MVAACNVATFAHSSFLPHYSNVERTITRNLKRLRTFRQSFDALVFQANGSSYFQIAYGPDNTIGSPYPVIILFTGEEGSEKVQRILRAAFDAGDLRTLCSVNLDAPENQAWYGKYKSDWPILHMGNFYWMKGRDLTPVMNANSIYLSSKGMFEPGRDESDATEMEQQQSLIPRVKDNENKNMIDADPKVNPRRSRSSHFQKFLIEGIAARRKGTCDGRDENSQSA